MKAKDVADGTRVIAGDDCCFSEALKGRPGVIRKSRDYGDYGILMIFDTPDEAELHDAAPHGEPARSWWLNEDTEVNPIGAPTTEDELITDPEVVAIGNMIEWLEPLDAAARARVIDYLTIRFYS